MRGCVQFKQLVKDTRERMAASAASENEGTTDAANESVDAPNTE
jgi:hypothetical protein